MPEPPRYLLNLERQPLRFLKIRAHPAASRRDRAFRLYLFCLRQKRIPLQSLAREPGSCGVWGKAPNSVNQKPARVFGSNPLRVLKSGVHAGFKHRSLPAANSIYPPPADSNRNSGIHAANPAANYFTAKSKKSKKFLHAHSPFFIAHSSFFIAHF
jgi:hypothetical protein